MTGTETTSTYTPEPQAGYAQDSTRSIVATVAALICLGAVTGAIATFLIMGLDALLSQLGSPTSQRFSQLIVSIFRRMSNVLVVWFQAPLDGAIMGAVTGIAVSIAYGITIWIDRTWAVFSQRKWLFPIVLAVAGALGAAASSRGVLTDVRFWVTLAGALYGLVSAVVIAQSRSEQQP